MTLRFRLLSALIAIGPLACTSSPPSATPASAPRPALTDVATPAGLLWTYETGG